MLIQFTADAVYETEGPGRGPRFAAGEVHELREDLALRWIGRGVAEALAAPAARGRKPTKPAEDAGGGEIPRDVVKEEANAPDVVPVGGDAGAEPPARQRRGSP